MVSVKSERAGVIKSSKRESGFKRCMLTKLKLELVSSCRSVLLSE